MDIVTTGHIKKICRLKFHKQQTVSFLSSVLFEKNQDGRVLLKTSLSQSSNYYLDLESLADQQWLRENVSKHSQQKRN